jgi:hypothetical protein
MTKTHFASARLRCSSSRVLSSKASLSAHWWQGDHGGVCACSLLERSCRHLLAPLPVGIGHGLCEARRLLTGRQLPQRRLTVLRQGVRINCQLGSIHSAEAMPKQDACNASGKAFQRACRTCAGDCGWQTRKAIIYSIQYQHENSQAGKAKHLKHSGQACFGTGSAPQPRLG